MSIKKTKQLPKLQQEILALLRAREGRSGTSADVDHELGREKSWSHNGLLYHDRMRLVSDALRSLVNKKIITRARRLTTPDDRCLFLYTAPSATRQPAVPASNFAAYEMEKLQSAEINFLKSEVERLTREIETMSAATTAPPRGFNVYAAIDRYFLNDFESIDDAIAEIRRLSECRNEDFVAVETVARAIHSTSVTVEGFRK